MSLFLAFGLFIFAVVLASLVRVRQIDEIFCEIDNLKKEIEELKKGKYEICIKGKYLGKFEKEVEAIEFIKNYKNDKD
jgi:hypothetical protein